MGPRSTCTALVLALVFVTAPFLSTADDKIGYARFLGPLSSGCQVTYWADYPSTVSTNGQITSPDAETPIQMFVSAAANPACVDTWTGLPPTNIMGTIAPAGSSPFVSTPTTLVSAYAGEVSTQFAYQQFGSEGVGHLVDFRNVISLMKSGAPGAADNATTMLATDAAFIALASLIPPAVSQALAVYSSGNTVDPAPTCETVDDILKKMASYISQLETPYDPIAQDQLSALLDSLADTCLIPQTAINMVKTGPLPEAVVDLSTYALDLIRGQPWALKNVINLAKVVALIQSAVAGGDTTALLAATSSYAALNAQVEAQQVNYANIAASFGLGTFSAQDLSINVVGTGPLKGANVAYAPVTGTWSAVQNLVADSNGVLSVPAATHGAYAISGGATDTFLATSSDAGVSRVSFWAIAPFTPAGGKITLAAPSNLVYYNWYDAQANEDGGKPTMPTAEDWKEVYEALTGVDSPAGTNYLTRNWAPDSAMALAVQAADVIAASVPTLGGLFMGTAFGSMEAQVQELYSMTLDTAATWYASSDDVSTMLASRYGEIVLGLNNTPSATSRRRLLEFTIPQVTEVLNNIGDAVAQTNARANAVLDQARVAVSSGAPVDPALFVQVAKVAQVQSSGLAAGIQSVATSFAAGDINAAIAASSDVSSKYTGSALDSAITNASVNGAAIAAATGGRAPEKKSSMALGVGLGIGLGVPVVAALAGIAVYVAKKRRAYNMFPPRSTFTEFQV